MSCRVYISILFVTATVACFGQQVELPEKADSMIDTILLKSRALTNPAEKIIHTLTDSVDNVNGKPKTLIQKTQALSANPGRAVDTLEVVGRLSNAKSKLTSKIDSLKALGLPHQQYSKVLDSLNNVNPLRQLNKVQNDVSKTENAITDRLNAPASGVNEKLDLLRKESGGQGNIPGNVKLDAPGLEMPGTEQLGAKLDADKQLPSLKNGSDPGLNLSERLNVKQPAIETKKVTETLNDAAGATEKISAYSDDIRNITSGNLDEVKQVDKDVLNKVDLPEAGALQENAAMLEQQKDMVRAMRNPDEFKKQTLAKAREIVTTQFATQQTTLSQSVQKVSLYQKKAGSLFGRVKGLPKRPRREKKPPFVERFVPGVTMQIQKTGLWYVDINPAIRYRIRSIFSAGIGWNERVVFDKDFTFYKENRIYGLRAFNELSVRKGFVLRADVERMNAFVPVTRLNQDVGSRQNVWSYMLGVKKEFSFVQGVLGNVQFMYNLYDPRRRAPYLNRFNVRLGFEFPLKRKPKARKPTD